MRIIFSLFVIDDYFLRNVRTIESVTQKWVQAIDSATTKDSGTDLSKVENIRTMITKFPNMEVCSVDESLTNNTQLRCIVCNCQGFVGKQKTFSEISLSGTEYNSQTLKNIDNAISCLKVIILVFI